MPTLKEILDNLDLELDLPETLLEYKILPSNPYTSYHKENDDGVELIVLTDGDTDGIPMEAIIDLKNNKVTELMVHDDEFREILSSIDEEGNRPYY